MGDKGSETFAYTQRLAAVKESALALIDKAIASTQVRLFMDSHRRRLTNSQRVMLIAVPKTSGHSPLIPMVLSFSTLRTLAEEQSNIFISPSRPWDLANEIRSSRV